jgi:2-dehydro-3-deoxyphosphooctonate aldolase (KDO 8-P synthase)
MMKNVPIKDFWIGEGEKLVVMCGPCVIESEEHTLKCALELKKIFAALGISLIFKASYDKANRSSVHSFRGPGIEEGLRILQKVKTELDLPVVTDVHSPEEAEIAGAIVDCLQIPAFLCRQTDLIYAAGKTGTAVSVKKGQFMAPLDMKNVVEKIHSANNEKVLLVERGVTFGYNNLVCDMRSIPMMQSLGVPVVFDATHAVQLPGGLGTSSGGERKYIPPLAKAAVAAGANCLFMEAHPDPDHAMSDKASVLDFRMLPKLLQQLLAIYEAVQEKS